MQARQEWIISRTKKNFRWQWKILLNVGENILVSMQFKAHG